jgi:predicted RecB family nuclease
MLSKSRLLAARQCRRRLWLEVNRPELREYGAQALRRFAEGQRLNAIVHALYPDGVLIDDDVPLGAALKQTAAHLARRPQRPLFEATFSRHRVLVRADVLARRDDGFQLTEVKSSTRVKPYHLIDCAVQHWVISEAGYPVAKTRLAHIDTGFTYRGDGDYRGLLRFVDVTEQIAGLLPEVPDWVATALDTLRIDDEPDIAVGPHCTDPFACPFLAHCSPPPPEYPVSTLPGGGAIIAQLQREGIADIRDIPPGRLQRPLHERVRLAIQTGEPYVGRELAERLRTLPWPRCYLDFETIQFAIPRWPDTRPYEQLPFQWSCHVEDAAGGLRHEAFLDQSGGPPMRACAEALIAALGGHGPVFTYSPFERRVIHALATRLPDLAPRLRALAERLFDLLPLVKAHYYHPAMQGSFSIKAVLPTVAPDLRYDALGEVRDGLAAQLAYEELIDPATAPARRAALADELDEYCRLDTLAMVRLVQHFQGPRADYRDNA